jgi:soluble lytic murein transglycosylase-like protein
LTLALGPWAGRGYAADLASNDAGLDEESMLAAVAWRYGLDADLLRAIAEVESGGRPRAVSPKGASGLMQLMPATARRFRVNDPFDPVDNALGAARFLSYLERHQLSSKGEANLVEMLAAYNAGEGAVERYHGVPPYRETQAYVRRVLWTYLMTADQPPAGAARAFRPQPVRRVAAAGESGGSEAQEAGGDEAVLKQLAQLRRERARARKALNSPFAGRLYER